MIFRKLVMSSMMLLTSTKSLSTLHGLLLMSKDGKLLPTTKKLMLLEEELNLSEDLLSGKLSKRSLKISTWLSNRM